MPTKRLRKLTLYDKRPLALVTKVSIYLFHAPQLDYLPKASPSSRTK